VRDLQSAAREELQLQHLLNPTTGPWTTMDHHGPQAMLLIFHIAAEQKSRKMAIAMAAAFDKRIKERRSKEVCELRSNV